MQITCAECGCRVEGGIIVECCEQHPGCCCRELPVRETDEPYPWVNPLATRIALERRR